MNGNVGINCSRTLLETTTMTTFIQIQRRRQQERTSSSSNHKKNNEPEIITISTRLQQQRMRRSKYDPTTKRPNEVCDPYGQRGKPMSASDAQIHKRNIDEGWLLVTQQQEQHEQQQEQSEKEQYEKKKESNEIRPPSYALLLQREFYHVDFLQGAEFVRKMAAVALVHNHYPNIQLMRKIIKKKWIVVSIIQCKTIVLQGLSMFDFHLAMMIDIELQRPEVKSLFILNKENQ